MATPNYDINYDDKRFTQVESEKQQALTEVEQTYGGMIEQSGQYYNEQIEATKQWAEQQSQLQQENTEFAIEQIEQQKAQSNKEYQKEQSGAYVDWQKQSNQYGANAEQMASNGLTNTGFSESSQVSMYNQYQNRVASARESYTQAVLNYNNAIKDAQLQNNSKQAEIAYNALQQQLELSLQGFQYQNQLIIEQSNKKQEINNTYYARYQDVLNQMNQENALAEEVRQYNENLALQKQQMQEEIRQFNQSYALQYKQYEEGIRQFDEEMARLKAQDKKENEYKIKQLELQKQQLQQEQSQWEKEYDLKLKQYEEEKRQFDKAYESSGGGGNAGINKDSSGDIDDRKGENKKETFGNSSATMKKSDYYFDNGYQPRYVNNAKLSKSGSKVKDVFGNEFGSKMASQNIWYASDGKFYIWDGSSKSYIDVTSKAKQVFNSSVTNQVGNKLTSGGGGRSF